MFARHDAALSPLIVPKERIYFGMLLVVSLAIYATLAWWLVLAPAEAMGLAIYVPMFALMSLLVNGVFIGRLRGNGVRVTPRQFPALHRQVEDHAATIGLIEVPDVFVLQSGGILNAFATRFLSRDFVVIYSDVLAMAQSRGERAVGFIVAHELAHVARGHLRYRWVTLPGRIVPYVGTAYSRACEYTCDAFGTHCQPDGAVDGLLALAAGPVLYQQVDPQVYATQAATEDGFWTRRAEMFSTHPHLTKRVAAVLAKLRTVPGYSPVGGGRAVESATVG